MAVFAVDSRAGVRAALDEVIRYFFHTIDPTRGILLKPNIVFPVRDSSGEITRLCVVKKLIESLRHEYPGIDIVIGEGTAVGSIPEENFRISGYGRLAEMMNVPLVDLHNADRIPVNWKFGTIELPRIVLERTYISLPILKQSSAAVISGALKNQKGIIPAEMKKQFHKMGLDEPLAQLNAIIQPKLTIMDCSTFFSKGVFLAGDNCGEIDELVCRMLGIEEPEHVRLSRAANVFKSGFIASGDSLSASAGVRRPKKRQFKAIGRLRLWSNPRACSMCRYLFRDLQRVPSGLDAVVARMKLLPYVIRGAEIIMGSNPSYLKERAHVICVGECTRTIAKENGYVHIPGCPPTVKKLRNSI